MNKILILGFGVASTAYISLFDHNKKKVSVLGTPFDLKKISSLNAVSYTHLTLPTSDLV